MNTAQFHSLANQFLIHLFDDITRAKIKLPVHWDIDHLCYRAATEEGYQKLKNDFAAFGNLLIESVVNGRMIATFKLHEPVFFQDWRIDLVELPAPKKGKSTPEGFEHIEVVCDVSFHELETLYSHLALDKKGLSKEYNQELEICLGERNIKFHHSSLESVISLEKKEKVFRAIMDSNVLAVLKEFHPLIAGTFPLDIDTTLSDVDVLIRCSDFDSLRTILEFQFSGFADFLIREKEQTLVCNFTYKEVPFEIFAEDVEPVRQTAYRHFQVEERLLKYLGEDFKTRVKGERTVGMKTEHAFAKLLNLQDDPYSALLQLSLMSGSDLAKTRFVGNS